MNQITILYPGKEPQTYDLDDYQKDIVAMGRGQFHGDGGVNNDIQIDNDAILVSRAHCTFYRDVHGNWSIKDDNSKNGLFFRDQQVTYHQLKDGDKVYVGKDMEQRLVILFSRNEKGKAEDQVKSYDLHSRNHWVLGRSPSCDIVINHPTASRQHCLITYENGQYYITDLQSKNGIILNSHTLSGKMALKQMDRISIADVSFVYADGFLYCYQLSGGVSVTGEHVCKLVGNSHSKKYITNNVSLSIEPNEFVAILGGSGAGKTTLLNCLSGMTDFTSGEVLINGESIRTNFKSLRSLMGYVPQQDIVFDSLTLEGMLDYSAKLRMPVDTSRQEIQARIDETLRVVELSEHRKTLISKLSGGQRKRASIAVELLASPKLFFLDEPTSGLDPGTAKHLMEMLKKLSKSGKTIIMVTHTIENLDMCDRLICMGKGGLLCYSGSPADALDFFEKDQLTDIYYDLNEHAEAVARKFGSTANPVPVGQHTPLFENVKPEKTKNGLQIFFRQFSVMTRRYVEILLRDKWRMALLLGSPLVLTFILCLSYQSDGNLLNYLVQWHLISSVHRTCHPFLVATDTMTLLFSFSCAVFWTGIFNSIQEISKERTIYERERFSGVGVVPYVLSKFVPLLVLCAVQSAIMTSMLSVMTNVTATIDGDMSGVTALSYGMRSDGLILGEGMMWMETFLTTFTCAMSAMCLGLLISTLVNNDMALVLCPFCLMPQILFAGVVNELSGFSEAVSTIISCRWSCLGYFISARINELYKSCTYNTKWELKTLSDGGGLEIVDEAYGVTKKYFLGMNGVVSAWVVLTIMCVVCTIAAMLILRFRPKSSR